MAMIGQASSGMGQAQQAGVIGAPYAPYAQNAKPPEGICDRLVGFITRLRVLSEELASAGDRIYGPQPKEVSGQAIAPMGSNHIAALAEIGNLIEQCEAETRRLQRGL